MIGECGHSSRGIDRNDDRLVINLRRTGERFVSKEQVEGIRGTIKIGALLLPCIERGDNYRRLPSGWYDCKCDWWGVEYTRTDGTSTVVRVKAIRVLGEYSKGKHDYPRILIHPANWPHQLKGCIAPGLRRTSLGVADSRRAMLEIFESIGGWEIGKAVRLHVEN